MTDHRIPEPLLDELLVALRELSDWAEELLSAPPHLRVPIEAELERAIRVARETWSRVNSAIVALEREAADSVPILYPASENGLKTR